MKKDNRPDLPVTIRVNKSRWKKFSKVARDNDSNASREVRAFVSRYISETNKKAATG